MSLKYTFLKRTKYILIGFILLIMITNLILNQLIPFEDITVLNWNGSKFSADEIRKTNIFNILFTMPIMGFVLGTLLSFIPFKNLDYKEKYHRFSLIATIVLCLAQLVSFVSLL